jgi:hypothetical protein
MKLNLSIISIYLMLSGFFAPLHAMESLKEKSIQANALLYQSKLFGCAVPYIKTLLEQIEIEREINNTNNIRRSFIIDINGKKKRISALSLDEEMLEVTYGYPHLFLVASLDEVKTKEGKNRLKKLYDDEVRLFQDENKVNEIVNELLKNEKPKIQMLGPLVRNHYKLYCLNSEKSYYFNKLKELIEARQNAEEGKIFKELPLVKNIVEKLKIFSELDLTDTTLDLNMHKKNFEELTNAYNTGKKKFNEEYITIKNGLQNDFKKIRNKGEHLTLRRQWGREEFLPEALEPVLGLEKEKSPVLGVEKEPICLVDTRKRSKRKQKRERRKQEEESSKESSSKEEEECSVQLIKNEIQIKPEEDASFVQEETNGHVIIIDPKNSIKIILYKPKKMNQQSFQGKLAYTKWIKRWFENPENALEEQGYTDPESPKFTKPEKYDHVIMVHSFGLAVDNFIHLGLIAQTKNRRNEGQEDILVAIPGVVKHGENGDTEPGLFTYIKDIKNGDLYHRNFVKRSFDDLYNEFIEKGYYDINFEEICKVDYN